MRSLGIDCHVAASGDGPPYSGLLLQLGDFRQISEQGAERITKSYLNRFQLFSRQARIASKSVLPPSAPYDLAVLPERFGEQFDCSHRLERAGTPTPCSALARR